MYKASRTFPHEIDGQMMQCIAIGSQEMELPSYLLQGEKACGYLYEEGNLSKWYWKGLSVVEGERCLYFDPLPLFPFSEIATSKRDQALSLVRDLARALTSLPTAFLDLSSGILPLWRIWGVEDGRLLILPQDIADLFSSCSDEETRYFHSSSWVHHGLHQPFTLCDQMTSLLYYAALGFPPFHDRESREDAFRALPLSYTGINLPQSTIQFIDRTLSLSLTKQRDAVMNKEPQKALMWFLAQTESMQWTLEATETGMTRQSLTTIEACATFLNGQHKRASRKIFWRKKGWLVITIAAVVISVSWFTVSRIQESRKPPYTAGMEPVQIVQEYYAGINELSLEKMEASLAKGVKNPSSMEVTNLYVTRQTRQAYEGINTQIDPNQWIAEGKPPILEGTFIYGIADLSVTKIGTTQYRAIGTMYTPYAYTEEETEPLAGVTPVYTYELSQEFSVEMGERGWYEITDIGPASVQPLEKLLVETYVKNNNNVQPQ
ncbi:MAG: hypothetical protein ACQ5SW_13915 [Sphaerochaetaceae bacterium]